MTDIIPRWPKGHATTRHDQGVTLYTINSARSRYQIICDYAATHDLTVKQVDELVRQLPDYGVKSMLAGSLAAERRSNVVSMASERKRRAG